MAEVLGIVAAVGKYRPPQSPLALAVHLVEAGANAPYNKLALPK